MAGAKLVVPRPSRLFEEKPRTRVRRVIGGATWRVRRRRIIEEKKLQLSTILLKLLIYIFLKMLITIIKLIRLIIVISG